MGMYTGLRVSVVVKPEWRTAIDLLHKANVDRPEEDKFRSGYSWERVAHFYPKMPGVLSWVNYPRRDFIPFGLLAYMPDDFSEKGTSYSDYSSETGQWTFCCSLKNYNHEIETFIHTVLKHIVERVDYCHSLYEEAYNDDKPWQECVTEHLKPGT